MPALGYLKTLECRVAELFDAASAGDNDAIAAILDDNVRRLPVDSTQWTPRRLAPGLALRWPVWSGQPEACALHCAAEAGRAETIHYLLDRGASADLTTRNGVSPLHLASFGAHVEAVAALLGSTPVDATRRCYDIFGAAGLTPLHMVACSTSNFDAAAACAELLLAAEAGKASSLHAVDAITGRTPLHFAAESLNGPLCSVLIAAGAWVQTPDAAGDTALTLAQGSIPRAIADSAADSVQTLRVRVMQELCWLPSVRMLWIAHKAPATTSGEGEKATVRDLTRDVVRLIADEMVRSHRPCDTDEEEGVDSYAADGGEGEAAEGEEEDDDDLLNRGLSELALAVRTMHESSSPRT